MPLNSTICAHRCPFRLINTIHRFVHRQILHFGDPRDGHILQMVFLWVFAGLFVAFYSSSRIHVTLVVRYAYKKYTILAIAVYSTRAVNGPGTGSRRLPATKGAYQCMTAAATQLSSSLARETWRGIRVSAS